MRNIQEKKIMLFYINFLGKDIIHLYRLLLQNTNNKLLKPFHKVYVILRNYKLRDTNERKVMLFFIHNLSNNVIFISKNNFIKIFEPNIGSMFNNYEISSTSFRVFNKNRFTDKDVIIEINLN
jgi:hypothetical protein